MLDATGNSEFPVHYFGVGTHTVSASYGGDNSYNPGTSAPVSFTVQKAATVASVTTNVNSLLLRNGDRDGGDQAERSEFCGAASEWNSDLHRCDERHRPGDGWSAARRCAIRPPALTTALRPSTFR